MSGGGGTTPHSWHAERQAAAAGATRARQSVAGKSGAAARDGPSYRRSSYIRKVEGADETAAYALAPRPDASESSRKWRAAARLASQALNAVAALT